MEVPPARIDTLFRELGLIDISSIETIRSEVPVPGRGSRSYTVDYADGGTLVLTYDGQQTHRRDGAVRDLIEQFFARLEVGPRYQ